MYTYNKQIYFYFYFFLANDIAHKSLFQRYQKSINLV